MNDTCRNMEMLISKMLDGELSQSDIEVVSGHITECPYCRKFYEEQKKYSEYFAHSLEDMNVPPCPSLLEKRANIIQLFPYLKIGAAVLLVAVVFYGGILWGEKNTMDRIPTYARVGAPAVWVKNTTSHMKMDRDQLSPLQDLISEYQFQIGKELGRKDVDWQKVRTMLETLGSLRTDLELLSLHMGYMDGALNTTSSPQNTWWKMIGVKNQEESL